VERLETPTFMGARPIQSLHYCRFLTRDYLSEEESEFNNRMSKVRVSVEWCFRKVILLFPFLYFKKNLKVYLQPVGKLYFVAVLLTNMHTCAYGSLTSTFFKVTLIGTTYRRHVSLRHERHQSSISDRNHATYLIDKSFPPKSYHVTSPHCNVSTQYLSLHQACKTSCNRFRSHSLTKSDSHALA
jgi:DDE superfamily endonuclease